MKFRRPRQQRISRGRRKFYKKYNSYKDLAYRAYKGVKMLKGIVNSELKHADNTPVAAQNITNNGTVYLINNIAQGDDAYQRDGNSILCKYIRLNFRVNLAASSAGAVNVRFVVFQDTANQGSTPAVTDYLSAADLNAFLNIDNGKRFVTLRDMRMSFSTTGTQTTDRKVYIPINNHLRYSSGTGTAVLQNAIYLLTISDQTANYPYTTVDERTSFYDN